jgi:hypothetical protein
MKELHNMIDPTRRAVKHEGIRATRHVHELPMLSGNWPDAAIALYLRLKREAEGTKSPEALAIDTRRHWLNETERAKPLSFSEQVAVMQFRMGYKVGELLHRANLG